MRGILESLIVGFWLLGLPGPASAKDDPDYSPAYNFRPQNVTDLGAIYAWVGSYYNATTQVDMIVEKGANGTVPPCAPLLNYTTSMQWDSILSILDRGPYNKGPNSVDLMYALMTPSYNATHLNASSWELQSEPPWWVLQSSITIWALKENRTLNDLFNFTTTKSSDSFSLTGTTYSNGTGREEIFAYTPTSTMPTCDPSYYTGNYSIKLLPGSDWWGGQGWTDSKLPTVNVTFNGKTANLTFDGKFAAFPYMRANDTASHDDSLEGIDDDHPVQGTIRFTFRGVLDAYHSDVLDMNGTTPTWLRTVGFGNNSLNIGSGSGSPGHPGKGVGALVVAACLLAAFL